MSVQLNHTIVNCRDQQRSAAAPARPVTAPANVMNPGFH
jgi:hypothetical protein